MVLRVIKTSGQAREIYRANALNLRSKGLTLAEVADFLEVSVRTVCNIEDNYEAGGLAKALQDDPRPGAPIRFDDRVKSHVVATGCSDPPEGLDRWTLELIRERVIAREVVPTISTETIRLILQEHDLKPWRQQSWCVPRLDAQFLARMEDILEVYERPLDANHPVLCLDEKPIQLLEEVRPPSGLLPGEGRRVDYEYKRNGTCNVFLCARAQARSILHPKSRRNAGEKILPVSWPAWRSAIGPRNASSWSWTISTPIALRAFDEKKPAPSGSASKCTPRPSTAAGSIKPEIALNIYARQCLGKSRIPDLPTLRKRTQAWTAIVNRRKVTIQWHFTRQKVREKFDYG